MDKAMRYRQIHLDFHTSGQIPDVGIDFDAEEFADTLKKAHVDSITCFARCHHGWLYYDSKAMPERIHPNLKRRNLLKEQIEACHKKGIKVPIYTTVQWDQQIAHDHYDWLCTDTTGAPVHQTQFKAGFYRNICLNSPYVEFFKAHIRDIFDCFSEVDGLFLDILNIEPCCCNNCMDSMKNLGLDVENEAVRYKFAQKVFDHFQHEITELIHSIQPGCPVFYNVGYIGTQHRNNKDAFTHLEIESLPGGAWGYGHFTPTAMYARTLGLPMTGQTGRFHLDWGDFSSLRYQASLEYECFRALAYGAGCSIGDQLHPNGKINPHTYNLVGKVYEQVEKKEPWCKGAYAVTEAAVMAPQEYKKAGSSFVTEELSAAVRFLNESCIQADVIDSTAEFEQYRLIILPDAIEGIDQFLEERLEKYIEQGGYIISSYHSGILKENRETASFLPADIGKDSEYSPDFILMEGEMAKGLPETEFVMYGRGTQLTPRKDTNVLLGTLLPYFNRTWEHYCSHRHTPCSYKKGTPALVYKNHVYQFSHPIFWIQEEYATKWIKNILKNVVHHILPEPLIIHDGPAGLELKLTHQPQNRRYILHALYYVPVRKGKKLEFVEDVVPIYNVQVTATLGVMADSITAVPDRSKIEYFSDEEAENMVFTIPKISGHEMIEISY